MQFCDEHWDALKAGVKARGLWHLVAQSGEAAMHRAVQEISGDETLATFDPLMSAHWQIANNALRAGGLYIMGDYCPLCEVRTHAGEGEDRRWIEECLDATLAYCIENGLRPHNDHA